jgi:hypothetical protein
LRMRVAIWAHSDSAPTLKLIWEGDLEVIPWIGWTIELDGATGGVPVKSVRLSPDRHHTHIGPEANVIVHDTYDEFVEWDAVVLEQLVRCIGIGKRQVKCS